MFLFSTCLPASPISPSRPPAHPTASTRRSHSLGNNFGTYSLIHNSVGDLLPSLRADGRTRATTAARPPTIASSTSPRPRPARATSSSRKSVAIASQPRHLDPNRTRVPVPRTSCVDLQSEAQMPPPSQHSHLRKQCLLQALDLEPTPSTSTTGTEP